MAHKGFTYHLTHKRDGQIIAEWDAENLMPSEGAEYILGAAFLPAVAKIGNWFAGLWSGAYAPTVGVEASTLLSLATEVTAYGGATRPAFAPSVVESDAVSDTTTFTFSSAVTVNGAFVSSSSTKNGADGTLVSVVRFSTARDMLPGDTLDVTNAVSLTE